MSFEEFQVLVGGGFIAGGLERSGKPEETMRRLNMVRSGRRLHLRSKVVARAEADMKVRHWTAAASEWHGRRLSRRRSRRRPYGECLMGWTPTALVQSGEPHARETPVSAAVHCAFAY